MRRVVLLALCALLLCGCARDDALADALVNSIDVSSPEPTRRPIEMPKAEATPAQEPEQTAGPDAEEEGGVLYLVSLYGESEDAFELKLRPMISLSDEDLEESMARYGLTYDDLYGNEGMLVCPDEEVFHTATVLKDSGAIFTLLNWDSDEPWADTIPLTAEKYLAYMRMMAEDGNSMLAKVSTFSGMVTGLEEVYVP